MTKFSFIVMGFASVLLSGCVEGVNPYVQSPDTIIAGPYDRGRDKTGISDAKAAIAYDPDGCQGWILDDGVEGYSGRRYDPVSGLPVCNNLYPPGTVLGNYQTGDAGIRDYVPFNGKRRGN